LNFGEIDVRMVTAMPIYSMRMSRPEILIIQCFRQEPGDVETKDCPVPGEPLDEAKRVTCERLLSYFNSDQFQSGKQPHTARLVGEDGRTVAEFWVRPKDGSLECVEKNA
jgi:hypothetical protein